jgi:hypothetical protein
VLRENKSIFSSHYLSTARKWRLGNAKANTARLGPVGLGGTDDEETKLKKSKVLAQKALQRL